MENIIAAIVFLVSSGGVVFILRRKIPQLISAPVAVGGSVNLRQLVVSSGSRLANSPRLRGASERVLQSTLSKTRVAAKRTEGKTGEWMEKLQKRSQEKKQKFSEDYWSQFKKR